MLEQHAASRDDAAHDASRPAENLPPRVAFESMAGDRSEVFIEYRGQLYRLRATRNGKLILNK
jgi:hemin uptake protein HemP